jgi:pimeloyl-ACP methyl ester carboxylesterase
MRLVRFTLIVVSFLLFASSAIAQQRPDFSKLIEAMEKDGCVVHRESGVRVCKRDYSVDGKNVEAVSFQPQGTGPFPALLLIPGHATTARDWIPNGLTYARNGYAGLAVSQPGYGRSEGPGDYVGPKTIKVLIEAYRRLQREPFVDAKRMGIFGYSRGGMAASLLAVQLDDVKAVILGAGIYDFKRAYDETGLDGIRQNMKAETGMTEEAIRQRSSVLADGKAEVPGADLARREGHQRAGQPGFAAPRPAHFAQKGVRDSALRGSGTRNRPAESLQVLARFSGTQTGRRTRQEIVALVFSPGVTR